MIALGGAVGTGLIIGSGMRCLRIGPFSLIILQEPLFDAVGRWVSLLVTHLSVSVRRQLRGNDLPSGR